MLNISLSVSQPFEIPLLRMSVLYLIGLFDLLMSSFLSSNIFGYQPSFRYGVGENLFPVCPFDISFALKKLFNFMRPHLLIVDLSAWVISVLLFRKLSPMPMHWRIFHTFLSNQDEFGSIPSVSILWTNLRSVGINYFATYF